MLRKIRRTAFQLSCFFMLKSTEILYYSKYAITCSIIFTQMSSPSLPAFFIQTVRYRKQPPSCTHMRAKRRLSYDRLSYILIQLYFRYPVAKSTTFRYGVPFAHAARFSPAILTIRSNVSGRKKFPAT